MTLKIFTVSLPFLLCLATMTAFAQAPCSDKVLTTSTTASVNTEKPAMKNFDPVRQYPMIFDWTRRTFLLHSNAGGLQSRPSLPSPFFQPDNSSVSHLQAAPDMQLDDGWELVRQDFGYAYQPYGNDMLGLKQTDAFGNLQPVGSPYFILYNKYTGILRVFVAIGQLEQAYNAAQMRIYQVQMNPEDIQSSLLYESSDVKPLIALDEFPASVPKLMAATPFINEGGLWFYADFPMVYDPCTCLIRNYELLYG